MSMYIFCQSDNDLKRYGLKSAFDVGLVHDREIVDKLGFTDNVWSNDTFCIMYDDSSNSVLNSRRFTDTSISVQETTVGIFLNEVIDNCKKLALFHCEPLPNKADWKFFGEKELFLSAVEKAMQDNEYG